MFAVLQEVEHRVAAVSNNREEEYAHQSATSGKQNYIHIIYYYMTHAHTKISNI